ncbi:MAG: SNF2-related protein, partial [Nannocystaceae bacterium]
MTASEVLDKVLPRWRATLPPRYSAEFIDGFIARNRAALEALVAQAMTIRRLRRGALPRTAEEFSAFRLLAERERKHDAATDAEVLRRVKKRMDKMLEGAADDESRARASGMQVEYALLRAEAMLLRQRGWDAVPLLLRRPSLAIYSASSVVLVHRHDPEPEEAIFPGFEASSVADLRADAEAAHEQATAIRAQIPGTKPERIATALWARARGSAPTKGRKPAKEGDHAKESAPAKERAPVHAEAPVELEVPPPDHKTKAWRTDANVRAMNLVVKKKPGEFSTDELAVLAQYSGWGGLSIEEALGELPASLRPESFGLIHEYYTPTTIAEAIVQVLCPYLPTLAGNDGVLRALEPSAGIGRLLRAFTPKLCLELEADGHVKRIDWTAVEFSKVSSRLLGALRPDVSLHTMPFERFVREEGSAHAGTFGLVVANPPYGERGAMAREDTDEFYKEKRAYAYFMRRALDLLIPGGIGVFLIPAGFLSGNLNRGLREKILRRHHLLGAYRLPSHDARGRETVPGASVVMDVIFWQSRGGELTEVDEADHDILEGTYFEHHPDHILGVEDGSFRGDDEAGMARSWRYKVTGDFTSLPPLTPRPVCTACVLTMIEPAESEAPAYQSVVAGSDEIPEDVDEALVPALELGARVGRYLAAVGQDDERAAQLWPELTGALRDFAEVFGNPQRAADLRALAEGRKIPAAQRLLGAFTKSGELAPALREPPRIEPKFTGQPDDVVAQSEALFRQHRRLTVDELLAFHARQGGTLDRGEVLAALFAAEWNLDGERWDELYPIDAYTSGNDLWERHDRAKARADQGDEQARAQVRRLLDAIQPAVFEDLSDLSPQHGYVPLELVAGWLSETLNQRYGPVELEREGGFVQVKGKDYIDQRERAGVSPETLAFLGYYNHDPALFQPPKDRSEREAPRSREERAQKKQSLAERRIALAKRWSDSFHDWVAAEDARREQLVNAYNRVARGRIVPEFSPEPLDIARWGAKAPKLRPHQIAGARRVLTARGGLVAFDVGVGKTYTALAIIARARQEGWVRRPVILVPGSLVWKWHDDILCTLPDYRVVVIGSNRKRLRRGARKGIVTSETDTPAERAQKWMALQTGQADVVVLSYDALARTRMSDEVVMAYIGQVEAVERSIALRRRALQEKVKSRKQAEKLSERERALLEHGVRAWVEEILALPSGHEYDPGIAWDEIGIDMLVIDEAAAFKNLYKPQPREDGVPKFMGGGGEGSDRAWQLDFRAAAVRQK